MTTVEKEKRHVAEERNTSLSMNIDFGKKYKTSKFENVKVLSTVN